MLVDLRDSRAGDQAGILSLLAAAFPDEDLRPLVGALLADPAAEPRHSIVAVDEAGAIVGHVLITAAQVEGAMPGPAALLAPLAVAPDMQNGGLGRRLVETALPQARAAGAGAICVLGDPDYYRWFGFRPAGEHQIDAPYPIPEIHAEAWMALPTPGIRRLEGILRPAPAFDRESLWRE